MPRKWNERDSKSVMARSTVRVSVAPSAWQEVNGRLHVETGSAHQNTWSKVPSWLLSFIRQPEISRRLMVVPSSSAQSITQGSGNTRTFLTRAIHSIVFIQFLTTPRSHSQIAIVKR